MMAASPGTSRRYLNKGIVMVCTACWPRSFVTAHSMVARGGLGVVRKIWKIAPDDDEDAPDSKVLEWTTGALPCHRCVICTVTGAPSASLPVQVNPMPSPGPGAPAVGSKVNKSRLETVGGVWGPPTGGG